MKTWFSPLCGEVPLDEQQRRDEFYRRRGIHIAERLMEEVDRLDQLIGMGELPPYWWHRKQGE